MVLPLVFIPDGLNGQGETRSFDQNKIKKYRSDKDYDYFKRGLKIDREEKDKSSSNRSRINYAPPPASGFTSTGWGIIIAIAVVLLLVVVLLIAKNADGRGTTRNEVIRANTAEIEQELDEEEIDKNDFDSLIEKAKSKGNYRLAIRLMFLKSLQGLDEKKLIKYKKNKTNYEYVFEIKNTELQNLFRTASDHFSWVWYGNQDIDLNGFDQLTPSFKALHKKIEA